MVTALVPPSANRSAAASTIEATVAWFFRATRLTTSRVYVILDLESASKIGNRFHMRVSVKFPSGRQLIDAWLYRPASTGEGERVRQPVIVMAHGLGGTKQMRLDAFAERFAAAGYASLVFDYRNFGASGGQPRQLLSVRRQQEDWRAALEYARSLSWVDPDRVVAWGTSFGGGHALWVAATDGRLAAAIAQCPFTDGVASSLAVPPWTSLRMTATAIRDLVRGWIGKTPLYLPNAAEPGEVAFLSAADSLDGTRSVSATADDYDNRLTARSAFDILLYAPGRHARRIQCPIFVALCAKDTVAPSRPARRQVARAPRVESRLYECGHFDIYVGSIFEEAVADYIDFLQRHIPLSVGAKEN
jgi:pimeloyl-ACP methyl ester carboxylesterase